MNEIFNTPPLFVNDEGVKWWLDESSTKYAHRVGNTGVPLRNHVVYYVEFTDGTRSHVIVDQQKGAPVYEHKQLDAVGIYIDALRALAKEDLEKQIQEVKSKKSLK
jgi:hypothetical protein